MSFVVKIKKSIWDDAAAEIAMHKHNKENLIIVKLVLKNSTGELYSFLSPLHESDAKNKIGLHWKTLVTFQPRKEVLVINTPPPTYNILTFGPVFHALADIKPRAVVAIKVYSLHDFLCKVVYANNSQKNAPEEMFYD